MKEPPGERSEICGKEAIAGVKGKSGDTFSTTPKLKKKKEAVALKNGAFPFHSGPSSHLHLRDMRFIVAVTLLIALAVGAFAATSDTEMPCNQITSIAPIWLNSSTQATKFVGNGFYAYSTLPNGQIYATTYPGLLFRDVAELGLIPTLDGNGTKCAVHVDSVEQAQSQGILYRNLDFASCYCKIHTGERMLRPTVLEKYIELTITRPDWPAFSMLQTFSLANDTVEIPVPPVETTAYLNFSFFYRPTFPKYSLEIQNWNWTVQNQTSGLRLFFNLHGTFDRRIAALVSTQTTLCSELEKNGPNLSTLSHWSLGPVLNRCFPAGIKRYLVQSLTFCCSFDSFA